MTANYSVMKKKKHARKKPLDAEESKPDARPRTDRDDQASANPYGGIPLRDLKKNLGCG